MYFADRRDAGRQLAQVLHEYKGRRNAIALAIPRGGVEIGEELHKELGIPLDIIITKKIPHPYDREYAIGAVGPDRTHVINVDIDDSPIPAEYITEKINEISSIIEQKSYFYRGNRPFPNLTNKEVILVDDGLATGCTMRAALEVVRKHNPKEIKIAVPVAPSATIERLFCLAEEIICLYAPPENFSSVSQFYKNFPQLDDKEVASILKRCNWMLSQKLIFKGCPS